MKSFFRALEQFGVRYLLISGQASVLYGASTFSEDVDLWVDPETSNWQGLLRALGHSRARVYKLTPPLQREYALHGHGFHFTLPDEDFAMAASYLDVMGVPPRVGSFRMAYRQGRYFRTEWGKLPVLHPTDLVEIKKTRRLSDYAVISSLVRIECRRLRSRKQWEWGLNQMFEAEDLMTLWERGKAVWRKGFRSGRPALKVLQTRGPYETLQQKISLALAREIEALRQKDRKYWQPIVAELKKLRDNGRLIEEGIRVRSAC